MLIGDIDPLDLEATKALCSECEIVGTACDGEEVIRIAKRSLPDIVIMSLSLHGMSGFLAARRIRLCVPRAKIIFFTVHSESLVKLEARRAGVSAFVSKRLPGGLVDAIVRVIQDRSGGMTIIDQPAADHLRRPQTFTRRQDDVLRLVLSGCPLKEIAATLGISPKTVEFHKYRLMAQLGVKSTAELIAAAFERDFEWV